MPSSHQVTTLPSDMSLAFTDSIAVPDPGRKCRKIPFPPVSADCLAPMVSSS